MDGRTTPRLTPPALLGALLLLCLPPPAIAQTVVLRGRVEDAVTRRPLADVEVFPADSSTAAVTDPDGTFTIRVPSDDSLVLVAGRVGYRTYRFELPESAVSRTAVLLLEPAPIEVEGIDVVGESAISEVLRDLRRRRNAYPRAVSAFDRTQLERIARVGSVWDFVRRRAFRVFECMESLSGLCAREGRGRRSIHFPAGPTHVPVCVDGRASWAAELSGMDIESVALIEIFRQGRDGIRVYTPGHIVTSARRGRSAAPPLLMGC